MQLIKTNKKAFAKTKSHNYSMSSSEDQLDVLPLIDVSATVAVALWESRHQPKLVEHKPNRHVLLVDA